MRKLGFSWGFCGTLIVGDIFVSCGRIGYNREMLSRGRAVVARQAHNLKVGGSNPPPARNHRGLGARSSVGRASDF